MSDLSTNPPTAPSSSIRTYLPTVTSSMKWWLAVLLGLLFFLIASPSTYNLTNTFWTSLGFQSFLVSPGAPNTLGVIVHALVFALIIRLLLW